MRESSGEAEEAAARLFAANRDEVLRHCLRRLGSRADAEDAVQTTFLYALRALRRGEVPESETAWLIAIATNVCRSQHRSASRRAHIDRGIDLEAVPERQPADEERDVLMDLPSALAAIPERQRHALLLREWHGLPTREVASLLGMSATATHALLTRARQSLAHALLATSRTLALDVVGLAAQLRSHLAAWLGGATGKTVAAGVLAAAVVVGGVATQAAPETRAPLPAPVSATSETLERPRDTASASSREPTVTRGAGRTNRPTATHIVRHRARTVDPAVVAPPQAVVAEEPPASVAEPQIPVSRPPSDRGGSPAPDKALSRGLSPPDVAPPSLPPVGDLADPLEDVLQNVGVEPPPVSADLPDPADVTVPVDPPNVPEAPLRDEVDDLLP